MDIGVIFPQTEIGGDRGAVRAYGQAASDLGYAHLAAYDHVLGADTSVHGDIGGPYDIHSTFHEPLLLFAHLAGFTKLAFTTSILIGPQRQTALLAKQAAELDLLCDGRFRLGLGIGWNAVEYEALDYDFSTRGDRLEEQVGVLRQLWTQESVTIDSRFHHITAAGLAPLPVQRPIPIWIGAFAPAALRRVGRVADGWFPHVRPGGGLDEAMAIIAEGAGQVGRDPSAIQFEGRVDYGSRDMERIATHAARWKVAGASHLSVNTMAAGCTGVDDHIAALTAVAEVLL
jgi:probable F420-dependent oxidoreductase